MLERGCTNPTLEKLEALCSVLEVHPVTLLAACYLRKQGSNDVAAFLSRLNSELSHIFSERSEEPKF